MNEPTENIPANPASSSPDVVSLIKKMQQQLEYLEKKIDTLIARSHERPSFKEKSFSKPYRSFGNSGRHERHDRYDRNDRREKREYTPRPREDSFDQGSQRRDSGPSRGFNPKKKPFFLKRKDQR